MKRMTVLLMLGSCLTFANAQNKLYVRVDYNPSMQILGFGGSGFYYDHVLLLPDGTAFRFDDVSDGFDQVLPGGIDLATVTVNDLANAGGTQGTYQDDGTTVQTSFGVSFASAGEKFAYESEVNGYMLIPPLEPSFITGEYNNFSATVIGGNFTNTPLVTAGESNNYFFYADGNFGFEESSGVGAVAGNVGVTSSSEGSAAGSFIFEGYNLFLTYSDGTQAVLPAYLWPPYSAFADQILMVGNDEFLDEDESSVASEIVPAGAGTSQTTSTTSNPLAGGQTSQAQNPLAGNGDDTRGQNPLGQPTQTTEQSANQLATPNAQTPEGASANALRGTVNAPEGVTISNALVIACPTDSQTESDCISSLVDGAGAYSLELPPGEYMVMAAMDATGDGNVNTGDYVSYQSFSSDENGAVLDFLLEPYQE